MRTAEIIKMMPRPIRGQGAISMIILNRDGSLTTEGTPKHLARSAKNTIEVPGDLIVQQPDLIDRIFTFAFDVLGLQIIDLRICPVSLGGHAGASYAVREY